jgi:selenide,water dikinase
LSPSDLAQVLGQLPKVNDPNLLIGSNTADDCAVYRINDRQVLVQTVDYFTPVVDDPFQFGEIAAANSLSDIYAMGCKPLIALNIIGYPKELPMEVLAKILQGGASKAAEAGIPVVGGHTIDDTEPKYGLVITALADISEIIANKGSRIGDELILTKPLGSGIITTAIKNNAAEPKLIEKVTKLMATLNRDAAEAMRTISPHACTDITGFGLLGHLHEMTNASRVGAEIYLDEVPVIEEVQDLARKGYIPGGSRANLAFLSDAVFWDTAIHETERLILCDAQTSGGLLIAVAPEESDRLTEELRKRGTLAAHRIGRITDDPSVKIRVISHRAFQR